VVGNQLLEVYQVSPSPNTRGVIFHARGEGPQSAIRAQRADPSPLVRSEFENQHLPVIGSVNLPHAPSPRVRLSAPVSFNVPAPGSRLPACCFLRRAGVGPATSHTRADVYAIAAIPSSVNSNAVIRVRYPR
jgi:hypothetical protein